MAPYRSRQAAAMSMSTNRCRTLVSLRHLNEARQACADERATESPDRETTTGRRLIEPEWCASGLICSTIPLDRERMIVSASLSSPLDPGTAVQSGCSGAWQESRSATLRQRIAAKRGHLLAIPLLARLAPPCLVIIAALKAHKATVNRGDHNSPRALTCGDGAGVEHYELFAHCRISANWPPRSAYAQSCWISGCSTN
jgi:hypothetical protein